MEARIFYPMTTTPAELCGGCGGATGLHPATIVAITARTKQSFFIFFFL